MGYTALYKSQQVFAKQKRKKSFVSCGLVKFNENRPKGSRGMRRTRKCYGRNDRLTDGLTDGLIDEGHSYNPLPLGGGGLKTVRL